MVEELEKRAEDFRKEGLTEIEANTAALVEKMYRAFMRQTTDSNAAAATLTLATVHAMYGGPV